MPPTGELHDHEDRLRMSMVASTRGRDGADRTWVTDRYGVRGLRGTGFCFLLSIPPVQQEQADQLRLRASRLANLSNQFSFGQTRSRGRAGLRVDSNGVSGEGEGEGDGQRNHLAPVLDEASATYRTHQHVFGIHQLDLLS